MTTADARVAMFSHSSPMVLAIMAKHYLESNAVPFDCATRLEIGERLRDMAELKRMWGDDDPSN